MYSGIGRSLGTGYFPDGGARLRLPRLTGLGGVREAQHGLDVVGTAVIGILPPGERHLTGDEVGEPSWIRLRESRRSQLVVLPVGVDRAEQDGVLQDHVAVEESRVDGGLGTGRGNPGEARYPVADIPRACLKKHLHMAGAFDDDVGRRGRFADISAVDVAGTEAADHLWFAAI